jgi:hypothetical protein
MTGQGQRETVEFDPNVVQRIALKYKTGRIVQGNRGNRVMFATCDDRVFFLDEDVAQLIYDLKLKPSAPFTVCRRQSGDATSWEVLKLGEQADGTFVVQAEMKRLDASLAEIKTRKAGTGEFATPIPASSSCNQIVDALPNHTPSKLQDALQTAVFAAHAAGVYAKSIGYAAMPQFSGDDIRAMAITVLIGDRA